MVKIGENIHTINHEKKQSQCGIHLTLKNLIGVMCDESEEMIPMDIHTRIIRNHRRNKYDFHFNFRLQISIRHYSFQISIRFQGKI